jgi:hypothetical protein
METASFEGLADKRQPSHLILNYGRISMETAGLKGISGLAAVSVSLFVTEYQWRRPIRRN